MKKFLAISIFFLVCSFCSEICPNIITSNALAANNNQILEKMENSIFGYAFPNESDSARLNRLEQSVYGKTSSAQTQSRINKLKKDLNADLIGQEITPKEDTFREDDDFIVYEKEPPEAAKMDYPAIDLLEKTTFNKEFKDKNIKDRLAALEVKTFGKTYPNDDLSTRTERLKAKIQPKNFADNMIAKQENNFYNGDIGKLDQNYHLNSYGDSEFDYDYYNNRTNSYHTPKQTRQNSTKPLNISSIEKTLYKSKFENEPMATRLSRIESSVFGTTFANDSESERLARISSAINAQKSARRYDSNRFSQNMATAFQIGTLILMVLACIL